MSKRMPVYIGNETIKELSKYCIENGYDKFLVVCDENTYKAFGKAVEEGLLRLGFDVILALLEGKEIIADEYYLMQVFLRADGKERIFLAVGSGTITDITRFVSHRTRTSFFSIPTAPSVDGFNSVGAPLVVGGLKRTYLCDAPAALFADLPTLCNAPKPLIAAGFGDMVGKLLSIADWRLGHLLWDEDFDEQIYHRSMNAALNCARRADEIGRASEEGVRILMEGLLESGFCMLDFGNSNPASGAEHHISHFWEMKLLQEHRPAIFHGAKVGVASIITAGWYDTLRTYTADKVANLLKESSLPDPEQVANNIRKIYGKVADQVIEEQRDFIFMSESVQSRLKQRILDCWKDVLEIASHVPTSEQITGWLRLAGAPVTGQEIGLSKEDIQLGLEYGHYLRKRFTINKLRQWLHIE